MRNLKLISTFVAIVGTLSATMFAVYDHLSMQRQEEAAFPYSNKVAVGGAAEGAAIINGSDNQVTIQGDNRVIVQNSPVTPDVVERECMNGIWSWKYEYPSSVGMIQMQGTSEYFDNGSYTVKGLMRVVLGTVPSLEIGYQIYVRVTGNYGTRS